MADEPSTPATGELLALGQAAAELAHELRNVLATIATSAHAAGRTPDDAARFLARIGKNAELGQRLVEDVMALARPLGELALETRDTASMLGDARATLELQATFEDRIETRTLHVQPTLFARLLHALYANAAAVGKGSARIDTHVFEADGSVVVDVHDDGPGVPDSLRATLFEPFATAREGGVGLGLALARRIAEAHGGRLTLRDDGAGTTFRIALPSR